MIEILIVCGIISFISFMAAAITASIYKHIHHFHIYAPIKEFMKPNENYEKWANVILYIPKLIFYIIMGLPARFGESLVYGEIEIFKKKNKK